MLEWIISSSILIAVIVVGRRFFKGRVSCRVQYGLWLLVVLRLLVPISPVQSSLSIANLLPESRAEQRAENQNAGGAFAVPYFDESTVAGQSLQPAEPPYLQQPGSQDFLPNPESALRTPDKEPLDANGKNTELAAWSAAEAAGRIWLAGTCILALWLAAVNGVFRFRVRRDRQIQEMPEELLRDLSAASGRKKRGRNPGADTRGRRMLPVYMTDQVGTPCMYGLFFPAIYITSQVAEDPWLFAMVLRHEQMHYRQGDHIWAVLRTLCLCIHWYNPLVWLAVALSRQDGELACDEGVLRQLGEENRSSYGEALLVLSAGVKPTLPRAMNLATSMSGTRHQLRERLSALVAMPRMAAGTVILVGLLSLGIAVCTFTGRADAREEDPAAGRAAPQLSVRHGVSADGQDMGAETDAELLPESGKNPQDAEESAAVPEETEPVYDSWDVQILEYRNEEDRPVAEILEGETVIKLTYAETAWSLSAEEVQYSREILYWACQALQELEQWTGTNVTEVCYSVTSFGDFYFSQTPGDMQHSRVFYDRCYGFLFGNNSIEQIGYATDMAVWFSPVKQYVTPPGYDKMTTEEILTWYFERSTIAYGSRVEEITENWEGDYVILTDQGTYYEFLFTERINAAGKGMSLVGPYDSYPQH